MTESKLSKSIVADFDGVITTKDKYPEIGVPDLEMLTALIRARAHGIKIVLSTCREGVVLEEALSFCARHGLSFDAVNQNLPERIKRYGGDCRKVSGDLILEDRAAGWSAEAGLAAVREMIMDVVAAGVAENNSR